MSTWPHVSEYVSHQGGSNSGDVEETLEAKYIVHCLTRLLLSCDRVSVLKRALEKYTAERWQIHVTLMCTSPPCHPVQRGACTTLNLSTSTEKYFSPAVQGGLVQHLSTDKCLPPAVQGGLVRHLSTSHPVQTSTCHPVQTYRDLYDTQGATSHEHQRRKTRKLDARCRSADSNPPQSIYCITICGLFYFA